MPKHQPERFKEYFENKEKTGFTIPNCDYEFIYDEHGGWRDEYGNYYDCDGQPVIEESEEEDDDYNSYDGREWSDYEDQYEKQYGPSAQVIDEFQNEQAGQTSEIIQKIAKNLAILHGHPKGEPLRVQFQILDIPEDEKQPSENELYTCYSKKVKDIINVFYENDDEEDAAVGYFVVKDSKAGQCLINLEGENIVGYDLTFEVEPFNELKVDPLGKDELKERQKKFVDISESQKLYVVSIEGGFKCKAKQFNEWLKSIGLEKHGYEIIKMKKSKEEGGKYPVMKIKNQNLEKINNALFEDKKVTVVEFQPKEEPEEKKEEQEAPKPKEEEPKA